MLRLFLAMALAVAGLVARAAEGGGRPLQRYESVQPHMGTLVKITLYADGEEQARGAFDLAFGRIRALDETLSDYRPDSELNRLVRHAPGQTVAVSRDLFTVLETAQDLAAASDGAFDITLGPLTRLWREARRERRPPDAAALREAARRTGYRKLQLDAARHTALLQEAGMALDVGALGKGYAASEALAVLRQNGIASALVALSGDIACGEPPPGSRGWRVAIHTEPDGTAGIPAVLELSRVAVSTAGAAEQHLDVGAERYSHIVDPSTRLGLTGNLTVTVIAPHGLEADAVDTAVSVLGLERGLALVESRAGVAALMTHRSSAGATLIPSSRLRALAAAANAPPPGGSN